MSFKLVDIDSDPRSLIASNNKGVIVGISRTFTENFGWSKNEIAGETLTVIIPQKLRDAHNLGFSRFITTGVPTLLESPLDLEIQTASGRIIKAKHYIWAEEREGKQFFLAEINPE